MDNDEAVARAKTAEKKHDRDVDCSPIVISKPIGFLQKSEDALIPQPLLPSLGEGEPDFKVPLPHWGEGFRVRAGTFVKGLINPRQICERTVIERSILF